MSFEGYEDINDTTQQASKREFLEELITKKKEPVLLYNALPKLLLENYGSTKISGNSNNNNKTLPQTAR